MMINKRLIQTVPETRKYICCQVFMQWCSLLANIILIFTIAEFLEELLEHRFTDTSLIRLILTGLFSISFRFFCTLGSIRMSYYSSRAVKHTLRKKIYEKLLNLGTSYKEQVPTSEAVQLSVEGIEQLETYFGAYLPQFFYSMLAPLTLFAVLSPVNFPSAIILLILVPLIPAAIAGVQTFAKKLLSRYWTQYTTLGDTFLENLQGLTTLKIYQADAYKQNQMNQEAENFRKITIKVLSMQLNSITIMDLVAYGGAALGVILSVTQFQKGSVSFAGVLTILLLSADFFIPMRQLGSFFHIAMNGMAASDKIFRLLDLPLPSDSSKLLFPEESTLSLKNVTFSYEKGRDVLKNISITCLPGSFTALVGESGCGKSTIASLLMGQKKTYQGTISVGDTDLLNISEESLMKNITYIGHNSYLFQGTVRDNLLMGKKNASDEELWEILERTKLADFLRNENGLDTLLLEKASNLSGGQRQRLALARSLLHDSPIYIFDEATSNIDMESENDIMEQILILSQTKTVILISHRLANVTHADMIYVLENGEIREAGKHRELLSHRKTYWKLFSTQQNLENYQSHSNRDTDLSKKGVLA